MVDAVFLNDQPGVVVLNMDEGFRAIDLRPLVAKSLAVVSLGEGGPFPDTDGARIELANEAGPVVDLRWRTGRPIGVLRPGCETSHGSGDAGEGNLKK